MLYSLLHANTLFACFANCGNIQYYDTVITTHQTRSDSTKQEKLEQYDIWIYSELKEEVLSGKLVALRDSSIFVNVGSSERVELLQDIKISQINSFRLRKENKLANGAFIGLGIGFGIGLTSAILIDNTKPKPKVTAKRKITYSLIGGGGGVLIGTLIGCVRLNFPISKSQSRYEASKKRIFLL